MQWWSPEALYQNFQGTDAEFVRVSLPAPSQECLRYRVSPGERCSENFEDRVGDPRGVCDESVRPLSKLVISRLQRILDDDSIPEAIRSPAYEALSMFSFSELQLDEIFALWKDLKDPRDAVCTWAAENLDLYLKQFVPYQYPRVYQNGDEMGVLSSVSISLGSATVLLVLWVACLVYRHQKESAIRLAQVEFLALLLVGSFFTASSSILAGSPATDGTCVAEMWFVDMGYTLGLVPLTVKIGAVHRIIAASERHQRLNIPRSRLFGYVALICALTIVFLMLCTLIDPPQKTASYTLTEDTVESGETIVEKQHFCDTDSSVWRLIPILWYMVLLFISSVIAFQVRNIRSDFSESRSLPMLIYSHFIFAVLRLITYADVVDGDDFTMRQLRSLIVSSDTLAAIAIYFMPKIVDTFRGKEQQTQILGEQPVETRKGYEQSSAVLKSSLSPQKQPSPHAREGPLVSEREGGVIACLSSPPISDLSKAIEDLSSTGSIGDSIAYGPNIVLPGTALTMATEKTSRQSSPTTSSTRITPLYRDTTIVDDSVVDKNQGDPELANIDGSKKDDDMKPLVSSLQEQVLEQQETIALLRKQLRNAEEKH
mmetsp:Transcript_11492/g.25547  ORF Transcript_11492/g.25547 Transcript_11492/m.25547 type:complete len:599 (-) Transcript_11492:377-2173(-)